jgi:hypothetical protein
MNRIDRVLIEATRCIENNLPEVRRLLRAGADVNAKAPNHGMTPLRFSAMEGNLAVVNELLSPNNDSNGTTTSILGKRKSRGANIEAKNRDGDTPLHCASRSGHLPVVMALVSGDADILAANDDRMKRLLIQQAAHWRKSAVSKYLLQHFYATICGPPLHKLLKDPTWIGCPYVSDTPPLRAALHQNVLGMDDVVEMIEYLVDHNPDFFSSRDEDGS